MNVIYLDRVFLLNAVADYLLLLTTARLAGIPLRRRRTALGAVLGGFYAVAVLLPGLDLLGWPVVRIVFGAAMAWLVFRPQPRRGRLIALFFLLSGALAGVLLALGLMAGEKTQLAGRFYQARVSWPLFVASTAIFYVLVERLFQQSARHGKGEIMDVTVTIKGKKQAIRALYDTGNTLCDPASGEAVLVLEQRMLYDLWPDEVREILRQPLPPEEKMVRLHMEKMGKNFSLLPFRSVGVPSGLMLAFRSDFVTVKGREHRRTLLGLSEGPLSDGGAYHALWGGEEGGNYEENHEYHRGLDQKMESAV